MARLRSAVWRLVLGIGVVLALALPGGAAEVSIEGAWIAAKAEQDGTAADGLVGHRLSFAGGNFEIVSKDGAPLYGGTFRVDQSAAPAAIDFEHAQGELKGKAWLGIFRRDGDRLTICDNAPDMEKGRPAAFEAGSGSGVVCVTFAWAQM